MNHEGKIERKLKAEIALLQIYSFFLIGLVTGISSIVITKTYTDKNFYYTDKYVYYLLVIGGIFLVIVFILWMRSFMTINKLTKL